MPESFKLKHISYKIRRVRACFSPKVDGFVSRIQIVNLRKGRQPEEGWGGRGICQISTLASGGVGFYDPLLEINFGRVLTFGYRGSSLIRNSGRLGPFSRTMPRPLWAVSFERGTPKGPLRIFLTVLTGCAPRLSFREESANPRGICGGIVFKAHRPIYHSTLGSRVKRKKRKNV